MKEWQKELYIYRLTPAPPKKDNLQEYIDLYLKTNNEIYFPYFLHYYEPTLNTTAIEVVRDYAMYEHFADIKDVCVFGIIKALQSYDSKSDTPFITYKTRIMWAEIHDYVRQMRAGFTVESETAYANLRKIMAIYNKQGGKCNDEIIKNISDQVGLSDKLVKQMVLGALRNLSLVDFYIKYSDEDAEVSKEDVSRDDTFNPEKELLHSLRHDAVFSVFDNLDYRERQVVQAHLGFCEHCHMTKGLKNKPQTFYEIAIGHQLSSAQAAEDIFYKAMDKMKQKLKEQGYSINDK